MRKNIVKENLNEILNFIENELRNTEHPIFVDISKKILDVYGIDIYPARVAQLCRKINEEKGLNKTSLDNNIKKNECKIRIPKHCYYKITNREQYEEILNIKIEEIKKNRNININNKKQNNNRNNGIFNSIIGIIMGK